MSEIKIIENYQGKLVPIMTPKEIEYIIIEYRDGSYKGYNWSAFVERMSQVRKDEKGV